MIDEGERKKPVFLHFKRIGNKIYEAIEFKGKTCFLSFEKAGYWKLEDEFEGLNEVYYPVQKNQIPYRPYKLDRETLVKLQNRTYKIDRGGTFRSNI